MTDDRKSKMPDDWDEAVDGEWDDEYASEQALAEGDDIELIVEYLNEHLDSERMEQVRKRLEEDDAFRDLAAPLLLTWSIPTHLERHPRPVGELERSWEEFVRRTGFPNRVRPARWYEHPIWRRIRYPLLALLTLVLGVAAVNVRSPIVDWYVTQRDFAALPYQSGWIPLGDSVSVELAPDASLRVRHELVNGARHVILRGTATFRILPLDDRSDDPRPGAIRVRTRGGLISAGESQFRVTARADTTEVEVLRPSRRRFFYFVPMPTGVAIRADTSAAPLVLRELDRARLVRGRTPERFPAP